MRGIQQRCRPVLLQLRGAAGDGVPELRHGQPPRGAILQPLRHTAARPDTADRHAAAELGLDGRYVILRRIGGGGMGAVYQAADQRITGKLWAIKEMSDAALTNPLDKQQAVEAFRREAQLLATLDHGNLPKVSDFFTEAGKHYLVMDFIQGQTLEQLLGQATGFLSEKQMVDWALQLCDVLTYLHTRQPPITFQPGKSRDTQAMGTPGYAAPEQYGTGQSDPRSDIYALGVTLHRLLTRYDPTLTPFVLPPARNINPAVSPGVAAAIERATQPDANARFPTMAQMKAALSGAQATPSARPAAPTAPPQATAPAPVRAPVAPSAPATPPRLVVSAHELQLEYFSRSEVLEIRNQGAGHWKGALKPMGM
jgi:serine/threonine-protein kinase